jgi:hypothetical protein
MSKRDQQCNVMLCCGDMANYNQYSVKVGSLQLWFFGLHGVQGPRQFDDHLVFVTSRAVQSPGGE